MNNGNNTVQKVLYDSLKSEVENYEDKISRIKEVLQSAGCFESDNKYLREISNIVNYSFISTMTSALSSGLVPISSFTK